jgi:hypothetical protein
MKENDLVLGDTEAAHEEALADYYADKEDIRADIDTAIYVFEFLDGIDMDGPDVINWNMKRALSKTKKKCLQIIAASIAGLDANEEE